MAISSAAASIPTPANTASAAVSAVGAPTITQNFDKFLQLLTTQLKNQNPLDPLDTNQFTQQLVQFAQVEQQINMNQSLSALIALQTATQASAAMGFLGSTVVVNGDTAALTAGKATWSFSADRPATATVNIKNASGEVVFTDTRTISAGRQDYTWNGRGTNGLALPDGNYTISITAKDATGQSVAVATEVEGVVDGVDLSQNPPVLKVGSRSFTLDKVKQVRRKSS
jgi:flagellar basal-body rod modification protein FlgD